MSLQNLSDLRAARSRCHHKGDAPDDKPVGGFDIHPPASRSRARLHRVAAIAAIAAAGDRKCHHGFVLPSCGVIVAPPDMYDIRAKLDRREYRAVEIGAFSGSE